MTPPDPKLHSVSGPAAQHPAPAHPAEAPRPATSPESPGRRGRKRRILAGVGAVAALALVAFGVHAFLTRGDQTTDDAFVEADVVAVAPRVGGTVAEVQAAENAQVRKGDVILRIDDADYQVKVRQAEAELETARAQIASADAQVRAARASVSRADAEAEKAAADLRRAEALKEGGALPAEGYDATRASAATARAGEGANRAQYGAALANAELARARVKSAEAALALAKLRLSWTVVQAPADGTVSRLQARAGEIVQHGQPFAELVPDETYVVANFKETQTGRIRPGERVDVTIDAYGGQRLRGRVESVSGGTGARFALLPPDNASGNFVKVVERVPVRIAWAAPPPGLPLRAGLSAIVTVHTR